MASKKTLTTAVEVDTDKAQRNLSKLGDAAKDAGKDLERAGEDFDKLGRDATDAGRDLDSAGDDADKLGRDAKDAAVDVDRLADELRNSSKTTEDFADDTRRAGDRIEDTYKTVEGGAHGTASAIGEAFGEGGGIQDGLGAATEGIESFAEMFGPAGLIVSAVGGFAIGAIVNFFKSTEEMTEEAMERISAAVDNLRENLGLLDDEFEEQKTNEWISENYDLADSIAFIAGPRGMQLLTRAINGEEDAREDLLKLIGETERAHRGELNALEAQRFTTEGLTDAQEDRRVQLIDELDAIQDVKKGLEGQTEEMKRARREYELGEMAAGRYADAAVRASRAGIGGAGSRGGTQQYYNYASGGPVEGGVPITVGEYGKEVFVPNTDGTIIPQHDLRRGVGGGGTIVVNVTTSDPDRMAAHTVRALRRARFRQGL